VNFSATVLMGILLGFAACLFLISLLTYLDQRLLAERKEVYLSFIPIRFFLARIVVLVVLISLVAGACYLAHVNKVDTTVLLMLLVFLAARLSGRFAGVTASVVSTLALSFLFLAPIGTFQIEKSSDRHLAEIYLISSFTIGMLSRSKEDRHDQGAIQN
jgi:K+-sensing histidine kinase KdpD